jgi:hypothetical protein
MAAAGKQYPGITYTAIENGWMEGETFSNYFTRNIIQTIHPERPRVLIYGHNSHIGVLLVEKARKESIVILKLRKTPAM